MMNTETVAPGEPGRYSSQQYDTYAILSLCFSLGALLLLPLTLVPCCLLSWTCPLIFITGIVMGFISLRQITVSEGRLKGKEMALAGIIIGFVGVGITVFLVLLFILIEVIAHVSNEVSFSPCLFHLNG
jgi:hypothetical protein